MCAFRESRWCRCHYAGKAHEALERGSDDSEAAGAWHIPAGPRQEGNVAAKMGRREAWARFLAYDVSTLPPLDSQHPALPARMAAWSLVGKILGCIEQASSLRESSRFLSHT